MKCWKCMADIPEDGTFCPVCGANVNEEKKVEGAVPSGGTEDVNEPEQKKGKGLFYSLAWCAFAVALTAGAAFYMKEEPVDAVKDNLFYIKNGDFFRVDVSESEKTPQKCSDLFDDDDYELDYYSGLVTDFYSQDQYISKDGKFLYYPEDMDYYDSTYNLYCQEEGKDKVKIDRNVLYYTVTDDNKVIYQKEGDALYLFDGTDRKKLASKVNTFSVDENSKYVLWTSYNDSYDYDYEDYTTKIFCQDLALAEEKKELESAGKLLRASKDFSKILISKKNSLYLIENFGEPVKLLEDADEVRNVDFEQNSFYFVRESEEPLTLMDYVDDDLKASDEIMTAPNRDDYIIEDEETDSEEEEEDYEYDWWNWDTEVLSDEYYEKQAAYEQKEQRDTIRHQLENEPADFYKALYLYEDGTETLVDSQWHGFSYYFSDEDSTCVSYYRNPDVSVKKVKISEMTDVEDARYKIMEANASEAQEMIASGGKTTELTKEEYPKIMQCVVSEDNQYLYFLSSKEEVSWDAENAYKLYCMKLDEENFGQVTEIDSEVDILECTDGPNVYYVKNARNYQGDLYRNGSLLMKNINEYTAVIIPDSTKLVCISDVDQKKNQGTLNIIQDGAVTKIADQISYCDVLGENEIIMLREYNEDKARGKLAYYDGKQVQDLDEDVFGIIPRGVGIESFSWSW